MTVIKINAITVPADSGDELGKRFAARAGAVDGQEGFEGFELLQPTDGRNVWLVITRWKDEASFDAWVNSQAFAHGHQNAGDKGGAPQGGHPGGGEGGEKPQGQVSTGAELWSYQVSTGSAG